MISWLDPLPGGRGYDFDVPLHLLVLGRTIMLIESMVRVLDPGFSLLDSLSRRSRERVDIMVELYGEALAEACIRASESASSSPRR